MCISATWLSNLLYSNNRFITMEDYHGCFLSFFCFSDEVHFDFGIKAIVRWKLTISFSPWEHTVICFIAYFAWKAVWLLQRTSCLEWREEKLWKSVPNERLVSKTVQNPHQHFWLEIRQNFLFLNKNLAKYLHMGDEAKRIFHVLKCLSGSGPEGLANLCLQHWFHVKCPYVCRELFFMECLKTLLHYKLYRKKFLQPALQNICGVSCCSG